MSRPKKFRVFAQFTVKADDAENAERLGTKVLKAALGSAQGFGGAVKFDGIGEVEDPEDD